MEQWIYIETIIKSVNNYSDNNQKLSFLLHEFGIRLLKSREISEYYYPLKLQCLQSQKHIIPSYDNDLKSLVRSVLSEKASHTFLSENNRKDFIKKFRQYSGADLLRQAKSLDDLDFIQQHKRLLVLFYHGKKL